MAASLLGLGLALGGTPALAQSQPPPASPAWVVVPVDRAATPAKGQESTAGSVNWRNAEGANAAPAPRGDAVKVVPFSATPVIPPGAVAPPAGPVGTSKPELTPPAVPGPDSQQVLLQAQPRPAEPAPLKAPTEENIEVQIQLTPPGIDRWSRRESEKNFQERMRQEARGRRPLDRIEFPPEPVLSTEKYTGRAFPPAREVVEPNYVCYQRLYFEQLGAERYGWDLGFFQPFLSAAHFYADLIVLPYKMGTAPCRHYDCNSGYCLPGDPVPLLLYPPDLSLTGAIFEATTIMGLYAIFPG